MRRCLLGALHGVFGASAEQTVRIAAMQCLLTHDHPAAIAPYGPVVEQAGKNALKVAIVFLSC